MDLPHSRGLSGHCNVSCRPAAASGPRQGEGQLVNQTRRHAATRHTYSIAQEASYDNNRAGAGQGGCKVASGARSACTTPRAGSGMGRP